MPHVGQYDTAEHQPLERRKLPADIKMARKRSTDEPDTYTILDDIRLAKPDIDKAADKYSATIGKRGNDIRTGDREELMELIKKGERPTWVPSANLQAMCTEEVDRQRQYHKSPEEDKPNDSMVVENRMIDDPFFGLWTEGRPVPRQTRSPLQRGDFNGTDTPPTPTGTANFGPNFEASPPGSIEPSSPPWLLANYHSSIGRAIGDNHTSVGATRSGGNRARAPSLGSSLSSSFILRTPTSPLAHAVRNSYMDLPISHNDPATPGARLRRRTLPPNSTQSFQMSPTDTLHPNFSRPFSNIGRESSQPHLTHQPRRSFGSFTYQPSSSPSSHVRLRRLSLASETLPRQLTSMVGSFEESILRGRMSSPASQPFDFVAQIGVVGKGDCPASLKCPPHVSVPFQAVFYRYPSSAQIRSVSDDAPSPYVGTIDLEHNLKPILLSIKRKRVSSGDNAQESIAHDPRAPENTPIGKALARDAENRKRRSTSPKMTLGGAYRVPQRGQLQIIIKNQNKTAVKLFLVPYDLEGMQAGTKTFVRQKSYSKGSIIDHVSDATAGTASLNDPLKNKQILRYLIHIKFCSPSRGKYYLHDHVRVVFANRVPDGKERLENEIQVPDPKYGMFRIMQRPRQVSQTSFGKSLPIEEQYEAPSSFLDNSVLSQSPGQSDCTSVNIASWNSSLYSKTQPPVNTPAPLSGKTIKAEMSRKFIEDFSCSQESFQHRPIVISEPSISPKTTQGLVPVSGFYPSTSTRSSPVSWASSNPSSMKRSFSPIPVEAGNGLLSQQFKNLNGDHASSNPATTTLSETPDKSCSSLDDPKESLTATSCQTSNDTTSKEEHSEQGDISLHPIRNVPVRKSGGTDLDSHLD